MKMKGIRALPLPGWRLAILLGGLAFLGLAVIAMLAQGQEARAATLTVTTVDDELNGDGDCSLREAIQAANTDFPVDACTAGSGDDTIVVPAGLYVLSILPDGTPDDNWDGDLDVLGDLTISGAGAGSTIINGGGVDRVLHLDPYSAGLIVEVSGATIQGGSTAGSGGGIANIKGTLTLNNSTVSGNEASSYGGGIYSGGTLTLNNSEVSGNTAGSYGGGIYGSGTFTNSTISGNTASGNGGGISGCGTITLSTISDNTAGSNGGGVYCSGTLSVIDLTVSGNTAAISGGGIWVSGAATTVHSSTISGNEATSSNGGGIYGSGTFTNSTISGNTAGSSGGGIYASSTLTLHSSTVTDNSAVAGGGIFNPASTATLRYTIIANSVGAACSGVITSDGHNLIEDPTGCTIIGDTTGNIIGQDPDLGPLADNGGSTQTHALLSGSPAIDAGSDDCPPPATDQRGVARPQGASCDIGAYEYEGPLPEKLGDVNCDGAVNVVDALFILQYEVGLRVDSGGCPLPPPPPDTLNVANCDVSDDGQCNVVDALFILQCEVGLPPGAEMDFCLAAVQAAQDE